MKKYSVLVLLLLTYNLASAQLFSKERVTNQENFDKQFLTWGYFLGFSSYDYKFEYTEDFAFALQDDILTETSTGFNVGLIGDMRLNDYFNLRFEPGLYITQRNLVYDFPTTKPSDLRREIKSTYIHFPLLLKASTKRINNFKPFILGGFSTALNLSSNEKNPDDNHVGQFRTKKSVLFYELGFGIDFYLEWFKFTPSIRGVFGLNDELVRDNPTAGGSNWTDDIVSMKTRGVFINFTFQ